MAKMTLLFIKKMLQGGAFAENDFRDCHFDFNTPEGLPVRLVFPFSMSSDLITALGAIRNKAIDARNAKGILTPAHTLVKKVSGLRFGKDALNQVAVISTQFQDGTSQDTALDTEAMKRTIRFLTETLQEFENQPGSPQH